MRAVDCIAKIYKVEGLGAFYRGLSTNLVRAVPSAMVTLYTYEIVVSILQ